MTDDKGTEMRKIRQELGLLNKKMERIAVALMTLAKMTLRIEELEKQTEVSQETKTRIAMALETLAKPAERQEREAVRQESLGR